MKMANEPRAAFLAEPSRRLPSLLSALGRAGYRSSKPIPLFAEDIYFDTQNGAFYRAGARLRLRIVEGQRSWQLEIGGGEFLEAPDVDGAFAPGPLREAAAEIAKGRLLLPQARVRSRGVTFVIEGFAESSFDAALLHETFAKPQGGWLEGRRALEITQRSGAPEELLRLGTLLRGGPGLAETEGDALEAALSALGLPLPGAPIPEALKVKPDDTVALAARKVLAQQAYRMWANTQGTIDDLDPEFLHDLRVAARRARSALRLFAIALGPRRCESLHAEIGSMARLLGAVRDLDVFSERLQSRMERASAGAESRHWLEAYLKERRAEARDALVPALLSKRYEALLARAKRLASTPAPLRSRGLAALPAAKAASLFIGAASKRVLKQGRAVAGAPEPAQLHRLRILAKRLRYATEFFRPVLGDGAGEYLISLINLQDCLGAHQDAIAATAFLQEAARQAAANAPPAVLLDLGSLIQVLREEAALHRAQFPPLWKTFRRMPVPVA
ncbi:MAG: CHAD domain-containing protein [Acidobacteria bacterium]|nr:CHAD domain-containing protein [Acidobacteriota bacterium]